MSLTPHEQTVVNLLFDGHKAQEIADKLGVSKSAIKTALSRIYKKENVRDAVDLVAKAYRNGGKLE